MGLFDYVIVESEMFPEELRRLEFQTKSELEEPFMETFIITKDGRLLYKSHTYEWKPKKKPVKSFRDLSGALQVKTEKIIDENFHGIFDFYSESVECYAKFTDGNLQSIEIVRGDQ